MAFPEGDVTGCSYQSQQGCSKPTIFVCTELVKFSPTYTVYVKLILKVQVSVKQKWSLQTRECELYSHLQNCGCQNKLKE